MNEARATTLITVEELIRLLDLRAPLALLDIQDEPSTAADGRAHIPGARLAYLATDFSGKPTKDGGRRPLPAIGDLQAKARSWGLNPDSIVVVYDENGGAQAARAWWTLRWAGLPNVRLLDGGLGAWKRAGRPPSTQAEPAPALGSIVLEAGHMPTLDADAAASLAREGLLMDARGRTAYLGAPAEPGKPPTGHIPGAVSAPSGDNITADGYFKPSEELRARFKELGAEGRRLGVYCGSGNSAAHAIAALNAVGLDAPLYVGSWSAWSADPSRPVATGPERG